MSAPTPPAPTPPTLADLPPEELAARLEAVERTYARRALEYAAAFPRACVVCRGAGLDLDAPAPPAGRPDACPGCTGATPARHPLDAARRLSRAEREGAAAGPRVDTSPAVMLHAIRGALKALRAERARREGEGEGGA